MQHQFFAALWEMSVAAGWGNRCSSLSEASADLSDLENHYREVLKTAGQGNYDIAIPELRKIIEQNPLYSRTYRSLVEAFIFTNKLAEAQDFFAGLNTQDPQNGYV